MTDTLTIRKATSDDVAQIRQFILELAIYEKAEHEVEATEADLHTTLFGEGATAHCVICESSGQAIGFAVYFFNYSTWQGRNGLYLEDLYVSPSSRGQGAGKALLKHLAKIAVDNNCGRFEWSVLDWNKPAIDFYDSLGAKPKSEWLGYRMDGQTLIDFANNG
ncbi:GNAT family N-acetyltransferase [Alteromonas sp. McT4-15]|jgi:GNAT superfamily N-acetyltransferase|uniref:GNAT family N-acetyltransferase n=1 Tax=Alteromonas sp. McT4-15 TaxID=2881256 RepID=UPI001CF87371|nr:GNAT family N-acetyltransferase [Alteromonas sp. McT4-15]MCB4436010.1 GNAT family N-acetyltransferase [Alteromonas sp. McT4-15]MEC8232611.1 GNAT family N-acetyltransferase [Pseudomonadota bacterium]